MQISTALAFSVALLAPWSSVLANEHDAKNFITVATGSVPSLGDARIKIVDQQLNAIKSSCAATSTGAGIHDKLAKLHSLLQVNQSLLELLSDFVRIASAQCRNIDDSTLISLYVLERNSGASHSTTVTKLSKTPGTLLAKWKGR